MADNSLTLKEEFLLNPVTEHNITGAAIATFETNLRHPVKVVIPFTPKQEGEGYPSPDNVRPISGLTGCKLEYTGKNLCVLDNAHKISITGSHTISGRNLSIGVNTQRVVIIVPIKAGATYTYGITRISYGTNTKISINDYSEMPNGSINSNKISTLDSFEFDSGSAHSGTVITNADAKYIGFAFEKPTGASAATFGNFYLNAGNVTGYEEPQGIEQIPITFTDPNTGDPLTVYGGTVTLNEDGSADIITTWAFVKPGTTGFGFAAQGTYQRTFNGVLYGGAYAYLVSSWHIGQIYSNGFCDKIKIGATSDLNGDDANITLHGETSGSSVDIWVRADLLADMSDKNATKNSINAWCKEHDITLVIRLRQSLHTYHFPNVGQLKAFLGTNNIWSDIGNVNVKYLTQNSETGMEYRGDRALELRRRAMLADAPTIHTTVGSSDTGGFASFKSYVKAPVKSVTIPFEPKQDLHGMDSPYPAGASVNLIPDTTDTENGYMAGHYLRNDNTTTESQNYYISEYFEVDPAITYTWSNRTTAAQAPSICFYDSDKTFISGINFNNELSHTFTPPEDAVYARSSQTTYAYQAAKPDSQAIQLEKGSTATPYQRYSNVCPIEGHTSIDIYNTINVSPYNYLPDQEGSGNPSPSNVRPINPYSILRDNGTSLYFYRGSIEIIENGSILTENYYRAHLKDYIYNTTYASSGVYRFTSGTVAATASGSYKTIYCTHYTGSSAETASQAKNKPNFTIFQRAGETDVYVKDASKLNYSSSQFASAMNGVYAVLPRATPVKYTLSVAETERVLRVLGIKEEVLPITFTDPSTGDPMTVYGGTVTLNEDGSADVVTDRIMLTQTSDAGWAISNSTAYKTGIYPATIDTARPALCNAFSWVAGGMSSMSNLPDRAISFGPSNGQINIKYSGLGEDVFRTIFNDYTLQILAYLKTPQTYHFSNLEQLKTFLGENNFWCDISDDITVKYWNRGFGN